MTGEKFKEFQSTGGANLDPLAHLKTIGVYTITCAGNGVVYVGSSTDVTHRVSAHLAKLRSGKHPCKRMLNDFQVFGEGRFFFDIASLHPTSGSAIQAEADLIADYLRRGLAYNVRAIGFYTPNSSENKFTRERRGTSGFDPAAKLRAWMERNGKSVNDLARVLTMSRYTAYRILWGAIPKKRDMQEISKWTRFEITANDFYDLSLCSQRLEVAA